MRKDDVIERLQKATGPDRELDAAIAELFGWSDIRGWPGLSTGEHPEGGRRLVPRYTMHFESAMSLVPETHTWHEIKGPHAYLNIPTPKPNYWSCYLDTFNHEGGVKAWGATPALAICIAALNARHD